MFECLSVYQYKSPQFTSLGLFNLTLWHFLESRPCVLRAELYANGQVEWIKWGSNDLTLTLLLGRNTCHLWTEVIHLQTGTAGLMKTAVMLGYYCTTSGFASCLYSRGFWAIGAASWNHQLTYSSQQPHEKLKRQGLQVHHGHSYAKTWGNILESCKQTPGCPTLWSGYQTRCTYIMWCLFLEINSVPTASTGSLHSPAASCHHDPHWWQMPHLSWRAMSRASTPGFSPEVWNLVTGQKSTKYRWCEAMKSSRSRDAVSSSGKKGDRLSTE